MPFWFGALALVSPGVWSVAGTAFTGTFTACMAYAVSQGLIPSPTKSAIGAYEYFFGGEDELTTLEELGLTNTETVTRGGWEDSFYSNKSNVDAYDPSVFDDALGQNITTRVYPGQIRDLDLGQNITTPILENQFTVTEAPKISANDLVSAEYETPVKELIQLETKKSKMIKTKEYSKLSTKAKIDMEAQIKQKENVLVNAIKTNNVGVQDNENRYIAEAQLSGNATNVVEKTPPVMVQNVKESKASNLAAGQIAVPVDKVVQVKEKPLPGALTEAGTGNPNGGEVPPNVGYYGGQYNIQDNKDVAVGKNDDSDVVEGVKKKKNKVKVENRMSMKKVGSNILYDLEPYNYEFKLNSISKEDYAAGISGFSPYENNNLIIKSSGLPDSPTATGSQLNHHIRSMNLNSTIGLNSKTNVSNVHGLTFTVFEPFGTSLLQDMHDAALRAGHTNYLQAIYLLTLKFHGYTDDGKRNTGYGPTKYFPIKMTDCQFNVTGGGTEYNFSAVPYNAQTITDTKLKTNTPINLTGKTVGELLFELQDQLNEQKSVKKDRKGYQIQIGTGKFTGSTPSDPGVRENVGVKAIGSPIDLLRPDGVDAELATDIYVSTMNHDAFSSRATSVMTELTPEGKKLAAQDVRNREPSQIPYSEKYSFRTYTFNTGTNVLDIIQAIIDSSDYIMRQFKSAEVMNVKTNGNGEVPWYKIDYRHVNANKSQFPNKFFVRPHWVDQYIALPSTQTGTKYNIKDVAREYNYIYTGENKDILDFNLQYNFAFFTASAAQEDKTPGGSTNSISKPSIEELNYSVPNPDDETDQGLSPIEVRVSDVDDRGSTQGTERGAVTGYRASNIIKEQLSNPEADLINLELDILGDPYYLMQEDFNPEFFSADTTNSYTKVDGSIDANSGMVYLKVNFKTPVDFNDDTGRFEGIGGKGKYDASFFGGFYRLINIESNFEEGRFTQRLNMVRLRHQELENQEKDNNKTEPSVTSVTGFYTGAQTKTEEKAEAKVIDGLYIDNIMKIASSKKGENKSKEQSSNDTDFNDTNISKAQARKILTNNYDRTNNQAVKGVQ
jgi:hypothetical protein